LLWINFSLLETALELVKWVALVLGLIMALMLALMLTLILACAMLHVLLHLIQEVGNLILVYVASPIYLLSLLALIAPLLIVGHILSTHICINWERTWLGYKFPLFLLFTVTLPNNFVISFADVVTFLISNTNKPILLWFNLEHFVGIASLNKR